MKRASGLPQLDTGGEDFSHDGKKKLWLQGCSTVLGMIDIFLSVSVLEDEWYEEFQGGAVLVQCEKWSPGCSK